MRNILLFTGNSQGAENLIKKALRIARQCKANLLLCNYLNTTVKEKELVAEFEDEMITGTESFKEMEELAVQLAFEKPGTEPVTKINCVQVNNFNQNAIRDMVIQHNIWLIIMDDQMAQLKSDHSDDNALKIINNLNCPVLLLPEHAQFNGINKIAYVTDLRYCDLGVIRFLKVFNTPIFVTHISAPGLPDLEERYAQEILADVVSVKANYWKIFLRNIKSKNIHGPINTVFDALEIKMLAFVNKKHQTLERLFDNFPQKTQVYHNVPTLIFPYLNWFNQASFYN
jgi:hypothetical protein